MTNLSTSDFNADQQSVYEAYREADVAMERLVRSDDNRVKIVAIQVQMTLVRECAREVFESAPADNTITLSEYRTAIARGFGEYADHELGR